MTTLITHYCARFGVPSGGSEWPGSADRGGEVRVPGSRADTDAVLKELQEWQAAHGSRTFRHRGLGQVTLMRRK